MKQQEIIQAQTLETQPTDFSSRYPACERKLKEKIDQLNQAWSEACPQDFVSYGFYPYYTQQKTRILFVGREAYGLSGHDYIETLYNSYINRHFPKGLFHHRIFYMAYGILHDFPDYSTIPWARDIASGDFQNGQLSFAFMNISTISNESEQVYTQWDSYAESEEKGRDFRRDFIDILQPDIIVCSNCGYYIQLLADSEAAITNLEITPRIATAQLSINNKSYFVFDTYHWSAIKKTEEDFYNPLRDRVRTFFHPSQQVRPAGR